MPEPASDPLKDPIRAELLAWFQREAPSLSPAYEGAVRMLLDPEFPGRMHFIAHAVRDIADRLGVVLADDVSFKRVQYEEHLDQIGTLWPQGDPAATEGGMSHPTEIVAISVAAARRVHALVSEHRARRERPDAYELLFRRLMRIEPTQPSVNARLVGTFRGIRKWFMGITHLRKDKPPDVSESELRATFAAFERMLHSFVGRFHTAVKEIDAALQAAERDEPPSEDLIRALIPHLASPEHERYFFGRLNNPHWIGPLAQLGYFREPPSPERVGDSVRHRSWPPSAFLARVARAAPAEVAAQFVQVKVDSFAVAHDVIDAAKAMPAVHAALLAPMIGELLPRLQLEHLLEDAGELVVKLAEGERSEEALALAKSAFDVESWPSVEAHRWGRGYGYVKAVTELCVPSLLPRKPLEVVRMLWSWTASSALLEKPVGGDKHSHVWRPAIESHTQNQHLSFASLMVDCLRDALEGVIREGKVAFSDVLKSIAPRRAPHLALRLRLHLLAEFGQQDPAQATAAMMDRALFADSGAKHEYSRLLAKQFPLLSTAEQEAWLSWVDAGAESIWPDYFAHAPNEEVRLRWANQWKFHRLHWIREHLTGGAKAQYERYLTEEHPLELADLNSYSHGVHVGHTSPRSAEALRGMEVAEALEFVRRWRPDPANASFDAPSAEGLADEFQAAVAADPAKWAPLADQVDPLPAIYVQAYLRGMRKAVEAAGEVNLDALLRLCKVVVDRPIEFTGPEEGWGDDDGEGWRPCRAAVNDLVESICKARTGDKSPRFGLDYREAIWRVIEPLALDPFEWPSALDEVKDPRVTDWSTIALNSTRGRAVFALLEYARWVGVHLDPIGASQGAFSGGFARMPELRSALEAQLHPDRDGFTSRAAIGLFTGLLHWLDREWLAQHAPRVFDLCGVRERPNHAFGWAAWTTFLFGHRPHISYFDLLGNQFRMALEEAATVVPDEGALHRTFGELPEHLIIPFGRGDFGDGGAEAMAARGGIVEQLVLRAPPWLRIRAISFAGQSLGNESDPLPAGVIDRFKVLWDRYWATVGRSDASGGLDNRTFGWWFVSGAFDDAWALERLEEFVEVATKPEPDREIMKRLVKVCGSDVARSLRIVESLVKGDTEGWRTYSWRAEAHEIVSTGAAAGGETREHALRIADTLARRGYEEFIDLLRREGP